MLIAATVEQMPPELEKAMLLIQSLVFVLLPVSLVVFARLIRRLEFDGPRTRPDLLRLPDFLAIGVIFGLLFIPSALVRFTEVVQPPPPSAPATSQPAPSPEASAPAPIPLPPAPSPAPVLEKNQPPPLAKKEETKEPGKEAPFSAGKIVQIMLGISLPTLGILAVLVMRGASVREIFGLGYRPWRALGFGAGLAFLAYPLTFLTRTLVGYYFPSAEPPQKLVETFQSATGGGDIGLIVAISASALIVAPVCEEILFRGAFYPSLTRFAGRIPAAFFTAVVFALIHDTVADAPSLALLAVTFTIAYEVTGNLLAPIAMHAAFNGINLAITWWLTFLATRG